jgi:hypothetical protein
MFDWGGIAGIVSNARKYPHLSKNAILLAVLERIISLVNYAQWRIRAFHEERYVRRGQTPERCPLDRQPLNGGVLSIREQRLGALQTTCHDARRTVS